MASEPNDLDQYVAYVRAELNKGKYTAFEFMSRERLREILDALTEARAALAVQARTHVVETPVLVQASRRTAYQPQGTPGAPAVTDLPENAMPSADWKLDSYRWRGRVLTGKFGHWCPDWDFLPIDETCPEWPCVCAKELGYVPSADDAVHDSKGTVWEDLDLDPPETFP